jgi:hypothetical protein
LSNNAPGVDIRIPGWGDPEFVEWIDPSHIVSWLQNFSILQIYFCSLTETRRLPKACSTEKWKLRDKFKVSIFGIEFLKSSTVSVCHFGFRKKTTTISIITKINSKIPHGLRSDIPA